MTMRAPGHRLLALARYAQPLLYAYYNDPFTPGFLRRNEVLVTVE